MVVVRKKERKNFNARTGNIEEINIIKKNKFGDIYYYSFDDKISNYYKFSIHKNDLIYNEINKLILKKQYINGCLNLITRYEYDNYGNCIKENLQYYHEDKNYKEESIKRHYDSHNNICYEDYQVRYKLQLQFLEGEDCQTIRKWEYEYNNLDDIVLMKTYNNGNLTICKYDYKYDSHNNCIERRAYISGYKAKDDILRRYLITYK